MLSAIQLRAVSHVMKGLLGKPDCVLSSASPRLVSPRAPFKAGLNDVSAYVQSEEIGKRVMEEMSRRDEAAETNQVLLSALRECTNDELKVMAEQIGIESLYSVDSDKELWLQYLMQLFSQPHNISCVGERTIVSAVDELSARSADISTFCQRVTLWHSYKKNFSHFVKEHVSDSGRKEGALKACAEGEYERAVLITFNNGTGNVLSGAVAGLRSVLSNLLKRALKQSKLSQDVIDERGREFDACFHSPVSLANFQNLFDKATKDLFAAAR